MAVLRAAGWVQETRGQQLVMAAQPWHLKIQVATHYHCCRCCHYHLSLEEEQVLHRIEVVYSARKSIPVAQDLEIEVAEMTVMLRELAVHAMDKPWQRT